jgi:predicted nucleic acid-binding protein
MRYLVDTDWAVWWLRGRPDVVQRLQALRTEGLAISAVTLGELVTGVRRSRDQARNAEALQHFLRRVTVLSFADTTAYRWGEEQARLLDAGETITEFDLAIAATALQHNLVLLTENRRHYERVTGLKLQSLADRT